MVITWIKRGETGMKIQRIAFYFSKFLFLIFSFSGTPAIGKKIFEDVTELSLVGQLQTQGLAFSDFDRDGLVDFATDGKLFKNTSTATRIRFLDVTQKMGLQGMKGRPLFADFNNDGVLEILTTDLQLYFLSGSTYQDKANKRGLHFYKLPQEAMTVSVADFNRDGWADILVGLAEEYRNDQFFHFTPVLFKNIRGQSFQEASSELGLSKFPGYTRGISWADLNNDTFIDFYLANYRLTANFLFVNSLGQFQEQGQAYGVQGEYQPRKFFDPVLRSWWGPQYGHSLGATWADFNNDGYFDLWVSNLVHKYVGPSSQSYDIRGYVCEDSKIYKNINGKGFQDVRSHSLIPVKPIGGMGRFKGDELWSHVISGDFDNDGLIDAYVSQVYNLEHAHSLLFLNQGHFQFKEISVHNKTRVIDSYTGATADLDNDGRLDLIVSGREVVDGLSKLKVLKNIYHSKNHFLKFQLVGTKSGKSPVGAQVRIQADSQILIRQFEGVTGTLNQQNDPILHFGVPQGTQIKQIEVLWPSGNRHTIQLNNIMLNQLFQITELDEIARPLSKVNATSSADRK